MKKKSEMLYCKYPASVFQCNVNKTKHVMYEVCECKRMTMFYTVM